MQRKIINKIFDWCVEHNVGTPQIFIGFNSNGMSRFEKLSNDGKIGVLAKDELVGRALLIMLYIFVTHDLDYIDLMIGSLYRNIYVNFDNMGSEEIKNIIKNIGFEYRAFPLEDKISMELIAHNFDQTKDKCLSSTFTLTRDIDEIDLYNLTQLRQLINENFFDE